MPQTRRPREMMVHQLANDLLRILQQARAHLEAYVKHPLNVLFFSPILALPVQQGIPLLTTRATPTLQPQTPLRLLHINRTCLYLSSNKITQGIAVPRYFTTLLRPKTHPIWWLHINHGSPSRCSSEL